MVGRGRPALRDLFDEAPTPLIGHPPRTHHLDYYLATDGSFREGGGGLGAVIETRDGLRADRLSRQDRSPDNNVAEYRALHLGLDVLASRVPPDATVGILVDHEELATNVNSFALQQRDPSDEPPVPVVVPAPARRHWRGIRARLTGIGEVRAARVDGNVNPAHPLANEPGAYAHLSARPSRCLLPASSYRSRREVIPPPSRARQYSSD